MATTGGGDGGGGGAVGSISAGGQKKAIRLLNEFVKSLDPEHPFKGDSWDVLAEDVLCGEKFYEQFAYWLAYV